MAGSVDVTFELCCPVLEAAVIDIDTIGPLCQDECATISSVTVTHADGTSVIAYNSDDLAWTVPAGISFDPTSSDLVCLTEDPVLGGKAYTIGVTYTDECGETVAGSVDVTFELCRAISSLQVRGYNGNSGACTGLQETYNELDPVPNPGVNDPGISWLYLKSQATPNVKWINFSVCYDVPGTTIEYRYRWKVEQDGNEILDNWSVGGNEVWVGWIDTVGTTADLVGCTNEFISMCMDAPSDTSGPPSEKYYCCEFEIEIAVNGDYVNTYLVHID